MIRFKIILLALVSSLALPHAKGELQMGIAVADITPPVGMRLCGTFKERLATGTNDPLRIRAFVFSQNETKVALAGCDLAMIHPGIGKAVRASLQEDGFEPGAILLHASETHNGPDYFGEFREVFHQRALAELGRDPAEPIDYGALLTEQFIIAIRNAESDLAPIAVSYASNEIPGITFNRRFYLRDGSIGWNPGKLNPDIVRPAGPTDDRLAVLSFQSLETGTRMAAFPGFAMHLAILNDTEYSADYPYYLEQSLKAEFGEAFVSHFLQSPCCELNHIDVTSSEPQKGHEWAEVVGNRLGEAAARLIRSDTPWMEPHLKWVTRCVDLELQSYSEGEVSTQRELWHDPDRINLPFLELVHAGKVTGIYDRHDGGPISVFLQAIQLSEETALIGLPSEVSVEIGLAIRGRSPFPNTMIVQLSNDWFGYIPTREIFDQGHYEAVVSKVAPGEGERLIEEALATLQELKRNP